MNSFFLDSAFAGVAISLIAYMAGTFLKKKLKLGLFNPLLISIIVTMVVLIIGKVDYESYNAGAKYLRLTHEQYVTLLPKSITTAIGMGVSEELGGYVTITVAVIVVTGVIGNILAEFICKVFRITDPIAKGVAIGTSAHAVGTAKAIEMGEIEGAMSSLSIAVAGILTVVGASVFANFL